MSRVAEPFKRFPILHTPNAERVMSRLREVLPSARFVSARSTPFPVGERYFQPDETLRRAEPIFVATVNPIPDRDNDLAQFMVALDALARVDVGTIHVFLLHFSDPTGQGLPALVGWMRRYRDRPDAQTFRLYTVDLPDPPPCVQQKDRAFERQLARAALQGRTVASLPWEDLSTATLFGDYLAGQKTEWGIDFLATLPAHRTRTLQMARRIFGQDASGRVVTLRPDYLKSGRVRGAKLSRAFSGSRGVFFLPRATYSKSVSIFGATLLNGGATEVSLAVTHSVFLEERQSWTETVSVFRRLLRADTIASEQMDTQANALFGQENVHDVSVAPLIAGRISEIMNPSSPRHT